MMLIVMGMVPILVILRGNSTAFPACMKATHRMKRVSVRPSAASTMMMCITIYWRKTEARKGDGKQWRLRRQACWTFATVS